MRNVTRIDAPMKISILGECSLSLFLVSSIFVFLLSGCNYAPSILEAPTESPGETGMSEGEGFQKEEIKFEDLPDAARAEVKKRLEKYFVQAPSGNHITMKRRSQNGWRFNGTGDEVFGDIVVYSESSERGYIRLNELKLNASKKPLSKADQLNGWTEKYLIEIGAEAISEIEEDIYSKKRITHIWFDASKGLNFDKLFVVKEKTGTWSSWTLLGNNWEKPNEKFDISKL